MAKVTSFVKHPQSTCAPDGSHYAGEVNTSYDNAEFLLSSGQPEYDVKTSVTDAFSNITTARYVSIRTDQTITVKFNDTGNHSITITSSDSPLTIDTLEVTNIYILNTSGSAANIKILLM